MQSKNRQRGASLLEVLLVIAAGAMLVIIGLRQFQSYQLYGEVDRLKQNVDIIFLAMNDYYKANCFAQYNRTSGTYTYGILQNGGSGQPNATNPLPININTALRGNAGGIRYLADTWPLPSNLINTTTGQGGYIAQFNRYTYPAMVCTNGTNVTGPSAAQGCTATAQIGTVVIWKPQVAVLPRVTARASAYMSMVGANCLSGLNGATVNNCASGSAGNYLVWERQPSISQESGAASSYTTLIPSVKAFTQMYRSPGIMYLIGTQSTATGSTINYITCGN